MQNHKENKYTECMNMQNPARIQLFHFIHKTTSSQRHGFPHTTTNIPIQYFPMIYHQFPSQVYSLLPRLCAPNCSCKCAMETLTARSRSKLVNPNQSSDIKSPSATVIRVNHCFEIQAGVGVYLRLNTDSYMGTGVNIYTTTYLVIRTPSFVK